MSSHDNPYRPPAAPAPGPALQRNWPGGVLGVACILAGGVGLACFASCLAASAQLGAGPDFLFGTSRGRMLLLIQGGLVLGTARLFLAARACFRGQWRAAAPGAILGIGLLAGSFWFVVSQARH